MIEILINLWYEELYESHDDDELFVLCYCYFFFWIQIGCICCWHYMWFLIDLCSLSLSGSYWRVCAHEVLYFQKPKNGLWFDAALICSFLDNCDMMKLKLIWAMVVDMCMWDEVSEWQSLYIFFSWNGKFNKRLLRRTVSLRTSIC